MPRQTIFSLQNDVERLLQIGASAIKSDEGLLTRRSALAALVPKVPAFAALLAQLDKLFAAEPRQAAMELLQLSAMLSVVRGSLAAVSVRDSELEPIPVTEPLVSRASPDDVLGWHGMITRGGCSGDQLSPRTPISFDLRLFSAWLQIGLDEKEGYRYWESLRQFPGIDHFVRRGLSYQGDTKDGVRLRALAALQREAAAPLVREALTEGSLAVQEQAFLALADLCPLEAEPQALALLSSRNPHDKMRALWALSYIPTEAAFDAIVTILLADFEDEDDLIIDDDEGASEAILKQAIQSTALIAVQRSRFPQAAQRLVHHLAESKSEFPLQRLSGLFRAPLTEPMSRSLLELSQRSTKYSDKVGIADILFKVGHLSVLPLLLQALPQHYAPKTVLEAIVPRLPGSKATFLPFLFSLLERFDVSDRYMVYHALEKVEDRSAVREALLARARGKSLHDREKMLVQTTFEKIRQLQRGQR